MTDLTVLNNALENAQVVRRGPFGGVKVVLTIGEDKTIKVTRNALTKLTIQLAQKQGALDCQAELAQVVSGLKKIDFSVANLLLGKYQKRHDRFFGSNADKREALLRGVCADAALEYTNIRAFPREEDESTEASSQPQTSRSQKRKKSTSSESVHPSAKKSRTAESSKGKPSSSQEESESSSSFSEHGPKEIQLPNSSSCSFEDEFDPRDIQLPNSSSCSFEDEFDPRDIQLPNSSSCSFSDDEVPSRAPLFGSAEVVGEEIIEGLLAKAKSSQSSSSGSQVYGSRPAVLEGQRLEDLRKLLEQKLHKDLIDQADAYLFVASQVFVGEAAIKNGMANLQTIKNGTLAMPLGKSPREFFTGMAERAPESKPGIFSRLFGSIDLNFSTEL
ncbi:MAG: hypothetical protein ACK5MA_03385 [Parachlamydiaceae bacterium]